MANTLCRIKYFIPLLICLMTGQNLPGQVTGDFQSHETGNWNLTSTWERWSGSAWITPAPNTPNGNSGMITIQNNLLKAKVQQLTNQYDYVFKMKLLEFYKGKGIKL